MARFSTPGVYVKENNAFSSSVVTAPTAIPAFIGYTEKAEKGLTSLINTPTRVNSLKEYIAIFGGAPKSTFTIKPKDGSFDLIPDKGTQFNLYNNLRLFYANGGGACYIVSTGNYKEGGVKYRALVDGLDTLVTVQEPSMVVVPDATLLTETECYDLYKLMLRHCGRDTKNRVAILDVYNGNQERTYGEDDVINKFRDGIGNNFLAYGASYYPWVNTSIISQGEVSFKNISNANELIKFLTKEAEDKYFRGKKPPTGGSGGKKTPMPKGGIKATAVKGTKIESSAKPIATAVLTEVESRTMRKYEEVTSEIKRLKNANGSSAVVDQNLKAISPAYKQILSMVREKMNLQATSGIMAGIFSLVDNTVGVHKAPANVSLNAVLSPTVNITSQVQEDLNLPVSGKAVNAIRSFVGKGVLVWGARTLDGNSQDWRYINVRRTLIMIEQSVKSAVENYVFAPNTPQTWLKVKIAIDNFLTDLWREGALLGISPAQAYETVIGLGSTMTPEDVLDGVMRVSIFVSIARPAEFVELTFEQRMQEGIDEGGDEGGEEEGDEGGDEGGDDGGDSSGE